MRALPGALRRGLLFMFSPCCLKFPSAPPSSPGFSELYRLLYDKVPYRARFRSDINAAVLTLQNTQRKDRRFYTALTGSHLWPQPVSREPGREDSCRRAKPQQTEAAAGEQQRQSALTLLRSP